MLELRVGDKVKVAPGEYGAWMSSYHTKGEVLTITEVEANGCYMYSPSKDGKMWLFKEALVEVKFKNTIGGILC